MSDICPHGLRDDDDRYAGVWAAPFSKCGCCGTAFPYIDSSSSGPSGGTSHSWTKDRCEGCGGHYIESRWSASGGPLAAD